MKTVEKLLAIAVAAVLIGVLACVAINALTVATVPQTPVRMTEGTSPIPPCWPPDCTPCPCGPWCDCTVGLRVDMGLDANGVPQHGHRGGGSMSCPKGGAVAR
jgi:hypothetical protein